jgi:chemotaxis protein MotA
MRYILGTLIVIGSVLGGYLPHGSFAVLFQPLEILIILGAALGSFFIATPWHGIKHSFSQAVKLFYFYHGYSKEYYLELLAFLFSYFDKARKSGLASLEKEINDPLSNYRVQALTKILNDKMMIDFFKDHFTFMISGDTEPFQMDMLLEVDIHSRHKENMLPSKAIEKVAQSLPAFGIVAAVLGVILTMGHIDKSVSEIGAYMSAALVGTFLGILVAYGLFSPLAEALEHHANNQKDAFNVVRICTTAYLSGYAAQLAIEFGRLSIQPHMRPSLEESEEFILENIVK